ncbi:MAG: hypothetical protein COU29_04405 [Candidatus Magasanikbacteria bacterium CG10_big_fil_rev_8_21_14_0_10_36_32]|uniref:UDP-N-acetylmuramoyl-L-alanyl-D-glutamate--2, 6-diaminopimelate ligase n=1 Tax=Candidatus Magasanikbacteria bacterium CG10_big_fil_rev_8_21_14_0_10_36_32 TaxID=1974646 RepID=A0A2M6W5F2_9BACT|nr:MAG: hypothetical protein COU29_04405 [Candidatus Magasanikbacteria bacterium CG10_big_fil_rev_8_21_14_0_10_36_32]
MIMLGLIKKIKKLGHLLLAWFFYWFYGRPARRLIVVGVTGTKGKSTTCRLIASVLESAGHKVGLLSTVEFQIGEQRWLNERKMTMLGRGEIQKMLKQMVKAGCQYAVVETSSEGILQYRHYGLLYDIAVFTNLSPEHVEAHGGFVNLKNDKSKIFAGLKKYPNKIINGKYINKIIIANIDDPSSDFYLNFSADEKWVYTMKNTKTDIQNNVEGKIVKSDEFGTEFLANGENNKINLVGHFNVYNALAAVAVGQSQKVNNEAIAAGLENIQTVEGRMEFIDQGQKFKVVVDYAHEPVSLSALFKTLRQIILSGKKIVAIIGSDGGGRDKQKRFKMGELSGREADIVVVTDVNCFDEDPWDIAQMIADGVRQAGKKDNEDLFVEIDRRKAITKAFNLAGNGDVVAITAKGTEPCIVISGGQKISWDDRKVAREELDKLLTA